MDFKEYVKLAMRTNVEDRSFKDNILNGLLGLYGETTEFYNGKWRWRIRRTRSCYWYTALLFYTTGLEVLNIKKGQIVYLLILVYYLTIFKKHFFQGHSLDSNLVQVLLSEIKFHLDFYAYIYNFFTRRSHGV